MCINQREVQYCEPLGTSLRNDKSRGPEITILMHTCYLTFNIDTTVILPNCSVLLTGKKITILQNIIGQINYILY